MLVEIAVYVYNKHVVLLCASILISCKLVSTWLKGKKTHIQVKYETEQVRI